MAEQLNSLFFSLRFFLCGDVSMNKAHPLCVVFLCILVFIGRCFFFTLDFFFFGVLCDKVCDILQ